jgi:hypothetical protein
MRRSLFGGQCKLTFISTKYRKASSYDKKKKENRRKTVMPMLKEERICRNCLAFEPTTNECRKHSPSLSKERPWPVVEEDWWCFQGRWKKYSEITGAIEEYDREWVDVYSISEKEKLK